VTIRELPIEEAKKLNAQAVFGEKYGSIVRVVDMEYSREFCGGTHVKMTGDIQKMAIISIETKGSGIFRIEGATGDAIGGELKRSLENVQKDIDALYQKLEEMIQTAKAEQIELKASIPTPTSAVDSYAMVLAKREELETLRTLAREIEKELNRKKMERETLNLEDYIGIVREVRGCKVLVTKVVGASINTAKDLVDRLSDYLKHSVVLVGLDQGDKLLFICKSQCPTIHAGNLVKMVSLVAGGNGGGRNDFAQAGAKDVTKCDEALQKGLEMIEGGI
jgi:alanyl-tRNA synthetase